MADHRPVTSTFAGERTATVHFHCPCGVNCRLVVCNADIHPVGRFTAALRRQHERGTWPPTDLDADEPGEAT